MMHYLAVISLQIWLLLCIQQNQIGFVLLDLSAGIFKVQQQDYKPEQLAIELARLMPSEILIDEDPD